MKTNTVEVADDTDSVRMDPNLLSPSTVQHIQDQRDVINLLIAARVGVRQLSWGAAVSSNPRDRERTTQQLKEVSQFLTDLIESNGVL